jgi:hypothetical protein
MLECYDDLILAALANARPLAFVHRELLERTQGEITLSDITTRATYLRAECKAPVKKITHAPRKIEVVNHMGAARAIGNLNFRECRWPFGDPRSEDFRFCGAKVGPNLKSYCIEHHSLAYRRVVVN